MTEQRETRVPHNALIVSDPVASWEAAGFSFAVGSSASGQTDPRPVIELDNFVVECGSVDPRPGLRLAETQDAATLDGIQLAGSRLTPVGDGSPAVHPNGITSVDHLVIATPNHERSVEQFVAAGLDHRKTTEDPRGGSLAQSFFWAGRTLLELVGPFDSSGVGESRVWGISFVSQNLNFTSDFFGSMCSDPKPAMQPGRKIVTLDTIALGLSIRASVMTPHIYS